MKRLVMVLLGLALAVGLVVQVSAAGSNDRKILEFDTMIGVTPPFLNSAPNAIRGVTGAGAAWKFAEGGGAKGELRSDGELEVEVKGLVLVNTGTNPIGAFRAIVSCLTITDGTVATANVTTDPFPATTPGGDSKIEAIIDVPKPCFAPIVFVGPASTRWFAVTGQS